VTVDSSGLDILDILSHWSLAPVRTVTRPDAGVMNLTVVVHTADDRVVLRGHRRDSRAQIERDLAVVEHVRSRGISAPGAISSPSGEAIVEHDGLFFSLFEFAPGVEIVLHDLGAVRANATGAQLAAIHDALADFEWPAVPNNGPTSAWRAPTVDDTLERIAVVQGCIATLPDRGEEERWAVEQLHQRAAWLAEHRDLVMPSPPDERPQVVHGDYQLTNLFFLDDAVSSVIDWDKAEPGFCSCEVVRAMHLGLGLRSDLCPAFLDGYRSVRQLTAEVLGSAAAYYGFWLVHDLWLFETIYLKGDDRARRWLEPPPYQPFPDLWEAAQLR
jgi:homoserine kinase type II